jgi:hypothetical protein
VAGINPPEKVEEIIKQVGNLQPVPFLDIAPSYTPLAEANVAA